MERKGARLASFGVFVALALIFSYIETLIPFQIGIPGVKLGLANLVIVIALYGCLWERCTCFLECVLF